MGGGGGGSGIRSAAAEEVVRCMGTGTSGGGSDGNKDNFGGPAASLSFLADLLLGLGSGIGSGRGGDSPVVAADVVGGELVFVEVDTVTSSF